MSAQGEDRSDYQAVLPPVDRSGQKLDFIWYKATEGVSYTDATYWRNIEMAKQHGVPFGSYHFLHPSLDVDEQVALFMTTVAKYGGLEAGAMLAVDSEISSGADGELILRSGRSRLLYRDGNGAARISSGVSYPHHSLLRNRPAALSGSTVDLATRQFLAGVRTAVQVALGGDHCQEVVYSFLDMLPQLASCSDFPLWAAYFSNSAPPSVKPWDEWTIWQYAGGGGNGGADQDGFQGDAAQFNDWRLSKMPNTPPPSPVSATFSVTLPELSSGAQDTAGSVEFVRRLQAQLAGAVSYAAIPECKGLTVDGSFGPKTEAAVKGIQSFARLKVTGTVGSAEWQFLIQGTRGTG